MSKIYKIATLAVLFVAIITGILFVIKFNMAQEQKHEQLNMVSEAQRKELSVGKETEVVMTTPVLVVDEKVIVYYFLTNFRCASCRKIEQYTKESIKEYFGNQMESGKLAFKAVNIEEKENKHFINDYQLFTKSVVVSLVKNGKEVKYKNLDKVWQRLNNKDKFYQYVKEETQKFLDEIKMEGK
ncbi:hypothetical protein KAS42_05040 [bacterium]|nr:hypothetical protein [bacterium]